MSDQSSVSGLLETIRGLRPTRRRTVIVTIDGYGGCGKSTLARSIASALPRAVIVQTDDFARPHVLGWEWERMRTQVLDPLDRDLPAHYQRYDWDRDALAEWRTVPVGGLVVIEGVSSMRRDLGPYWDLAIWVNCPREVRLARGIARDGEAKRSQWEDVWMPDEDRYVREESPQARADRILDGEMPFPL